jgi:hypothetical protein
VKIEAYGVDLLSQRPLETSKAMVHSSLRTLLPRCCAMAAPFRQLSLPADPAEAVPCALPRMSAAELAAALRAERCGARWC